MWQINLTEEQAKTLQQFIHLGLKQVAMVEGMTALIAASKAAEELLSLPKKIEEPECQPQ